jgi:hypothetical protein
MMYLHDKGKETNAYLVKFVGVDTAGTLVDKVTWIMIHICVYPV